MPETTREVVVPDYVPEFLRKPVAALQTRVGTLRGRRGLRDLLASSDAGLHEVERFLEKVAREDWTVSGIRRRMHAVRSRADNARATAMRRVDELPAAAVSALASAGRARVHELSRGLQAIARRIEPPKPPAANGTAAHRPMNGA